MTTLEWLERLTDNDIYEIKYNIKYAKYHKAQIRIEAQLHDVPPRIILKIIGEPVGTLYEPRTKKIDFDMPKLIAEYKQCYNLSALARKYNCQNNTIRRALVDAGQKIYSVRPRRISDVDICVMRTEGKTITAIAAAAGASFDTVEKILLKNGIKSMPSYRRKTQ